MHADEERIIKAMRKTKILRGPKQTLVTFGSSTIHYYLLTQPAYTERRGESTETVIREGKVIAEKPRVVTPYYLMNLEGFSGNARRYLEMVADQGGGDTPGLFYRYQNEYSGLSIVSEPLLAVGHKLADELNSKGENLAVVIKGVDELWDVSLMKFIHDYTDKSVTTNVTELGMRGLLDVDKRGVPGEARQRINDLFAEVERGQLDPSLLKAELDRWGLFSEYEDRFFRLFRKP